MNAREIAELISMPRLMQSLGFVVNERTRRATCILHNGSNPTAFSWREDGRWYCFSCGRGGDRIALVRAVRSCSFREAVNFLAALAGVEFSPRKPAWAELQRVQQRRNRAEQAAWQLYDKAAALRSYYADALRRAERLAARVMQNAYQTGNLDAGWEALSRVGPTLTFFLAAFNFSWSADAETLARLALASGAQRRKMILEGNEGRNAIAA